MTDYSNRLIDNRYQLIKPLGEGGMGSVYLAHHVVIGRDLAVKFLHTEFAGNKGVVKRFFREAQATAQIKHRGIIDVFDMGITDWGEPFLVMEYLEGESLAALMERVDHLTLASIIGVLEPVLEALSATHRKGIIHRDIKPSNIFVANLPDESPSVKLIDFGISKFRRAETHITQTGALLGTLDYMAPEQWRGDSDITAAADLWAIGVVFYEMLTGQLPFAGDSATARYANILNSPPLSPRTFISGCPDVVEKILMRALKREAADRYNSADEMLADLKTLPGYEARQRGLDDIVHTMGSRTSAVGDLGPNTPQNPSVAREMFEEIINESMPPSGTEATMPATKGLPFGKHGEPDTQDRWSSTSFRPRKTKGMILSAVGAGVLILAVAFAFLVNTETDGRHDDVQVPLPVTMSPMPEAVEIKNLQKRAAGHIPFSAKESSQPTLGSDVTITVQGAPDGATILFGGKKMSGTVFSVPRGEQPISLQVEAKGYKAYAASVLPSGNTTVSAKLIPTTRERTGVGGTAQTKRKSVVKKVETKKENNEPSSKPTNDEAKTKDAAKTNNGADKSGEFVETFE